GRGRRRGRCLVGLHLRGPLLIERDEIDRIEQKWRKAAVAHRSRDNLARERKQQPRAFDHDQRMQVLLRHILDAEDAGEGQVEGEQHRAFEFRLAFELERNLEVSRRQLADADIDLDVDRGLRFLRRQRARGVGVLEREILDVLAEHAQLRPGLLLLRLLPRAAIGCRHETYLRRNGTARPLSAGWLTQPMGRDKDNNRWRAHGRFLRARWSSIFPSGSSSHWSGARSMTTGAHGSRRRRASARPIVPPAQRRNGETKSKAPNTAEIKPGNTRRIPPIN